MKQTSNYVVLVLLVVFCSGCIPWVISASLKAHAEEQAAYSEYVTNMERLNTDREKAQLTPRPIMNFDDWKRGSVTNRPSSVMSPNDPRRK